MKWWKDLVSLLLPLFRRLILARHLVPSTNVCAHRGTKTLRCFTHTLVLILCPCTHTHTHAQTKSLFLWHGVILAQAPYYTKYTSTCCVGSEGILCLHFSHNHPNNENPSSQLFYSHANKHTPAELAALTNVENKDALFCLRYFTLNIVSLCQTLFFYRLLTHLLCVTPSGEVQFSTVFTFSTIVLPWVKKQWVSAAGQGVQQLSRS